MVMTREAYGQYLRGYAAAAFKPLVLHYGSTLTSVVEDEPDHADGFIVRLSARHRDLGSSYGPCPILIPIRAVEDNRAEECIEMAIERYRTAFPAPFPAGLAAEAHPVAQAIASLAVQRTIGGR